MYMSEYVLGELVCIRAYDHFSSDDDNNDHECIAEFCGVIIEETKLYLKLRHIKADINRGGSAEEYHHILKVAIIEE